MKRTNLQTLKHSPKRILSLLLVLALLCTALPQLGLPARAEEEPDPLIGADEQVLEETIYFGTRIDTAQMLYRMAGEPAVEDLSILNQFTDLDPEIYSEKALRAVAWAVSNRITSGVGPNSFGPELNIFKEQAITFIWKSFGAPAYEETDCPYSDVKPGKYYYYAVMWSLGQTDWLDPEPDGSQFGVRNYVYYYKLFQCVKTDGSRCWKLRIGCQNIYACGDSLVWRFDDASGTLRITGSGEMWDYSIPDNPAPWYRYRNDITSVSLPEDESTVGSSAFADCTNLTELTLPVRIASLGQNVFAGCTALSSVTVLNPILTAEGENPFGDPASVVLKGYDSSTAEAYAEQFGYEFESLGKLVYTGSCGKDGDNLHWSFEPFTGILEITGSGEMQDYSLYTSSNMSPWYQYRDGITSLILPDKIDSIGNYAFYGCTGLNSVTLPERLTSIGDGAFYRCTGLTSVTFPEGLTSIGNEAFSRCTGLSSVTLPEGLTNIGIYTFSNCTGLNSIEFPESLTNIGDSAFSNCTGLSSVALPEGLTNIGSYTFSNCTGLSSVTLPEGLTNIGSYTFSNCTGLSSVTLPEGLASIGSGAFSYCTGLTSVTLPSTLEFLLMGGMWEFAAGPFENCENLTALVFRNPNTYVQTGGDCDTGEDLNLGEYDNAKKALGVLEKTVLYAAETSVPSSYCDYEEPGIFKNLPTYAADYGYTLYRLGMFSDVKEGKWYEIPVAWAYGKGITSGTGEGTFSPHDPCKREQIVTFIWKAYGSPTPGGTELPFTDLKAGKYYMDAVRWAYYHDPQITSGIAPGVFGVGETCTRGQVVTFLWNAAGRPEPEDAENPFNDVKESDYYYKAVLWAVENGITSGTSPTTFGPKDPCTRAHVVSFLYKAVG